MPSRTTQLVEHHRRKDPCGGGDDYLGSQDERQARELPPLRRDDTTTGKGAVSEMSYPPRGAGTTLRRRSSTKPAWDNPRRRGDDT
ncbi:hypothetical protein [Streptomyces nogalater]|uniref:Uncharacterized protein n=1 Tax=Streptomyces nogalater TaxID=38314 RepID=A0ABW0WS39_STRNO